MSAEPRIVSAVGVCCLALNPGDRPLATRIQQAMSKAVSDALAAGVSIHDSPTIKARMLEARRSVLAKAGVPDDSQ